MDEKYRYLKREMELLGRVVVSYSGGVDSTFLLYVAHLVLGEGCIAVTVNSPLLGKGWIEEARRFTGSLGIRHEILDWDALSCEGLVHNGPDRCYHCKREIFEKIREFAEREGCSYVLDGSHNDDEDDYRPGRRALEELEILSPLLKVGLKKAEIKALSRREGIRGWERPSESCLATRFPIGRAITFGELKQVDEAEAYLKGLGYPEVRVRHHGEIARIELPEKDIVRFINNLSLKEVYARFQQYGFTYAAIDIKGYRRGSMNTHVHFKE